MSDAEYIVCRTAIVAPAEPAEEKEVSPEEIEEIYEQEQWEVDIEEETDDEEA